MAGAGLWLMGSAITQKLMKVLRDSFTLDKGLIYDTGLLRSQLHTPAIDALSASPVFVAVALSPRLLQLRLTPY